MISHQLRNTSAFSSGRLARGVASSVIGQFPGLVQSLILVPLCLRAWGPEGYGRWLAITAAVTHLTLVDFGGQVFVGNSLAHAFTDGDEGKFRRKLVSGLSLSTLVTLGTMLVVILLSVLLPSHSASQRALIVLLAASYLLSVPAGLLATAYRATGQLARGIMIGNICRGLGALLSIVVLAAKATPLSYAILLLAIAVLHTLVVVVDLRRRLPIVKGLALSWATAKQARSMVRGSLVYWILSLSQTLSMQGILLVLAFGLGDQAVALYATHRTAASIMVYATSLLQPAFWSELSFLVIGSNTKKTERLVLLSISASVLIAGLLGMALWTIAPTVYSLWTHHAFSLEPPLLAILTVQLLLSAGWSTVSWPLLAANRHSQLATWSLANATVTIGGGAIAIALGWRILGVAGASLFADIICGLSSFPFLTARFLNIPVARIYGAMARPMVALLPLFIVCAASVWIVVDPWRRVSLFLFLCALMIIPTAWAGLGKHSVKSIYFGMKAAAGRS